MQLQSFKLDPDLILIKNGIDKLNLEISDQINKLISLAEIEESILEQRLPECSGWSIKEHLEHLCVTSRTTLVQIELSLEGKDTELGLNDDGVKLFKLLYFPRGETQAPKFAFPKGVKMKKVQTSLSRLQKGWVGFSDKLIEIETGEGTSSHPFLGHLKPLQWIQFLCMHQHHHLGIIDDLRSRINA